MHYTSLFCSLPSELQSVVLGYIDKPSLYSMFDLDGLVHRPPPPEGPFLQCRQRALVASHTSHSLTFSNVLSQSSISLAEIHYLQAHGIKLSPSRLQLVLFLERTDLSPARLLQYLCYFQTAPQQVHLYLHVRNGPEIPQRAERAVAFVHAAGHNVTAVTVKHVCSGHCTSYSAVQEGPGVLDPGEIHAPPETTEGPKRAACVQQLYMENLASVRLNLFAPNHLPRLFQMCTSQALGSLNLAYNNLTEWHVSQLRFPPTLKTLDLSNNSMHVLSNDTLPLSELPCLEVLDLSNNNLMCIELFDSAPGGALVRLDISGNLLRDYSALFKSPFFGNLEALDLSRNLLDSLTEIPHSVNVDLDGNYFRAAKRAYSDLHPVPQ